MRDKYVASSIELVLRDGKSKSALREMFLRTDERTRFLFVRALSLNVNLENVLDVEEYVKTHCVKDVAIACSNQCIHHTVVENFSRYLMDSAVAKQSE